MEINGGETSKGVALSRRDFLKLGGFALGSIAARPLDKALASPDNSLKLRNETESTIIKFDFISPDFKDIKNGSEGSEGQRAVYIDPEDPNKMSFGSWYNGFWPTKDGGKFWTQEDPLTKELNGISDIQREIINIPDYYLPHGETNGTFIVSDYSSAIRTEAFGKPLYRQCERKTLNLLSARQCGAIVGGGMALIGGDTGIEWTQFKKISSNKPNIPLEVYPWDYVKGLPGKNEMVRDIEYDEVTGEVFAGGWGSRSNKPLEAGLGFWVSNDNGKTFQKHPLFDQIKDARGPLSINSIKVCHYEGHQIIFIGGEGSGVENGRKVSKKYPFLFIIVDGKLYPADKTNFFDLAKEGGSDLVTAQKGFAISKITNELYVSVFAGNVVKAPNTLERIVNGEKLDWKAITSPMDGQKRFGAVHIDLSVDLKGFEYILVGRQIYGDNVKNQKMAIGCTFTPERYL